MVLFFIFTTINHHKTEGGFMKPSNATQTKREELIQLMRESAEFGIDVVNVVQKERGFDFFTEEKEIVPDQILFDLYLEAQKHYLQFPGAIMTPENFLQYYKEERKFSCCLSGEANISSIFQEEFSEAA